MMNAISNVVTNSQMLPEAIRMCKDKLHAFSHHNSQNPDFGPNF